MQKNEFEEFSLFYDFFLTLNNRVSSLATIIIFKLLYLISNFLMSDVFKPTNVVKSVMNKIDSEN